MNKIEAKIYVAEPLRTENSWRVISNTGRLVAFRVSQADAERIAAELNAK